MGLKEAELEACKCAARKRLEDATVGLKEADAALVRAKV